MTTHTSQYHQPVGFPMPEWTPRAQPERVTLTGRTCRLEPFSAQRYSADLYAAYASAPDGRDWTYMFVGPFASEAEYLGHAIILQHSSDPLHFAVIDQQSGRPVGTLALMRIDPQSGVLEVGSVAFSPQLKRTVMATEAHYLLMRYAMETPGYRRYEWKCDSCNAPSKRAAERLGFRYEGLFRQAVVYRGRSRDTCWFSIIDSEWPQVKAGFERWLSPDNFDQQGQQREKLQVLRAEASADLNPQP